MIEPEDIKVGDILVLNCKAPTDCNLEENCSRKSIHEIICLDGKTKCFKTKNICPWRCMKSRINKITEFSFDAIKHWQSKNPTMTLEMII